jgi:hypothetical protein
MGWGVGDALPSELSTMEKPHPVRYRTPCFDSRGDAGDFAAAKLFQQGITEQKNRKKVKRVVHENRGYLCG